MEQEISIPPDTSEKALDELATSSDPSICRQVAQHPNTSPITLIELFKRFPKEVLSNPALDLILLKMIRAS